MRTQHQMITKAPKYIMDALKSGELGLDLETISIDDKKEITDYTVEEVVKEAKYILSLYSEGGTASHEELTGEDGEEAQLSARKEVRTLKAYIKKYDVKA